MSLACQPLRPLLSLLVLVAAVLGAGCASVHSPAESQSVLAVGSAQQPSPPPLQRSLFAREPSGQLTEDALQRILAAPWEITLPARVGVVPIVPAYDMRGPAPSNAVPAATGALARALRCEQFTLVTEVMAIPSGALGMEALRELAARYRLRYLVLYREEIATRVFANGWASLYATVIGAFFVPGETLRAAGYVEASLFDVKTGLLLATVRRPVFEERVSNVWGTREKLGAIGARLAIAEAPSWAPTCAPPPTRWPRRRATRCDSAPSSRPRRPARGRRSPRPDRAAALCTAA